MKERFRYVLMESGVFSAVDQLIGMMPELYALN